MSAPDISYALILMGCWKRDAKPHGCAEACELAERSILYQQARIVALERQVDDLQRLPQPLVGFIPQTYGDAIRAGWIKHGDCPPHEWDNRTSASNARWMIERAGFASQSGDKTEPPSC